MLSGGTLYVSSGGTVAATTLSGLMDDYGTASGTVASGEAIENASTPAWPAARCFRGGYEYDAASDVGTQVASGSEQDIYGSASNAVVSSGGIEIVESGGTASELRHGRFDGRRARRCARLTQLILGSCPIRGHRPPHRSGNGAGEPARSRRRGSAR